jgi:hypothetical protein
MLILLTVLCEQEGNAFSVEPSISLPQCCYTQCFRSSTLVSPPMANFQLAPGTFVSTQERRWEEISLKVYVYPSNTNEMIEVCGFCFVNWVLNPPVGERIAYEKKQLIIILAYGFTAHPISSILSKQSYCRPPSKVLSSSIQLPPAPACLSVRDSLWFN